MPQNDSESNPAVPGGSLAKPLIIALLALLASRAMSGGQKQAPAEAPKLPESGSAEAAPGDVLDGLGGLIDQFQKKGLGEVIDSWVNSGQNKSVAPDQVSVVLGGDVVNELSRRTGLSRDQVVDELARLLPNVVDKLTPDGRPPTRQEINAATVLERIFANRV
jgi:uncharacterized protein YidB (DUF937 family)